MITCSVCGGTAFTDRAILWDDLASEWQLAPHERAYIDRQQGTCCNSCGSNLRSIALSDAIRATVGTDLTLIDFAKTPAAKRLTILEINEAGSLSTTLRQLGRHVLATYPTVDMHSMPYSTNSFEIIVHSDTLEHISNPIRALAECRRILRPHGVLCFTIPTIIGRLTRSRAGLPKSYHGSAQTAAEDLLVYTEFGADMWTYVMQAGFSSVAIYAVDFPSAIAICARKQEEPRSFDCETPMMVAIRTCQANTPAAPPVLAKGSGALKPDKVVSVHFPKAAGSSLFFQLSTHLGDAVSLDIAHDPLTSAGTETAEFPIGKRVVHGHFRAHRYAATPAYWITFLRNPVDNLISIYFYWKSLSVPGHALHQRFLREQPSIIDFAMYPGIQRLMSETYFGGFDMSRFDFIGFYETRHVDIPRLASSLGLPLIAETHIHKTPESTERLFIESDSSTRQSLNDLLAEDIAFYERLR